jgi:hypothetical protein
MNGDVQARHLPHALQLCFRMITHNATEVSTPDPGHDHAPSWFEPPESAQPRRRHVVEGFDHFQSACFPGGHAPGAASTDLQAVNLAHVLSALEQDALVAASDRALPVRLAGHVAL